MAKMFLFCQRIKIVRGTNFYYSISRKLDKHLQDAVNHPLIPSLKRRKGKVIENNIPSLQ